MINTYENNEHYTYEVWALGYTAEDECTDTEIFLGKFETPTEAIEHAKNFYDLECFTGKPDHPDFEDLYLEEGEYLEVQVQKVTECEDPEDGTECVDVLWQNTIYQESL